MNLMDRVLHAGEGKIIRRLNRIVGQVNSIEEDYVAMDDDELAGQTADFRQRLDNGESLDRLLPEAFATVREASKRVLGKRCLLYTSPSPRDGLLSRMPSSA